MRLRHTPIVVLALVACSSTHLPPSPPAPARVASPSTPSVTYPATRATDTTETLFGTVVDDRYRWLEKGDDPEVKAWTNAQDAFARARLDALPHRSTLFARLEELGRYQAADRYERRPGGRVFFMRRAPNQEKWVLVLREPTGVERVLIDPNAWSPEGNPTLVDHIISRDGKKIAYGVSSSAPTRP